MQAVKNPQEELQKKQQNYQDTGVCLMVLMDTMRDMTTEIYKMREERGSEYQGKGTVEQGITYYVVPPQRMSESLGLSVTTVDGKLELPEIVLAEGEGKGKDEIDAESSMRSNLFKNLIINAMKGVTFEAKLASKDAEIEELKTKLHNLETSMLAAKEQEKPAEDGKV
jgi:hypothetical protein